LNYTGIYCCETMGYEGANWCTTMGHRNKEQQEPEGNVERYGCATMVWDHIRARLALDTIIWDNVGARMM
jgi:hypothetical protein